MELVEDMITNIHWQEKRNVQMTDLRISVFNPKNQKKIIANINEVHQLTGEKVPREEKVKTNAQGFITQLYWLLWDNTDLAISGN